MIDKLTEQQELDLQEHYSRYLSKGLSTEPADRATAEAAAAKLLSYADRTLQQVIWCASPLEAETLINRCTGQHKNQYNGTFFWGQSDLCWVAFYQFCEHIGIPYSERDAAMLDAHDELGSSCGWIYFFSKATIFCDRPDTIKMKDKQFHAEGGPAVRFRDGWAIWALNGIRVPQWVAEDAPEDMDAKKVLDLKNVDQRREAIRRMGIERFVNSSGAKVLHQDGDYSLLEVSLGDDIKGRFLKMLNPSLGIWHVEGVPPGVSTVDEALHVRKPKWMQDIPVADDGEDWEQQGDVVLVPRGATSLKPRPRILT